LTETIFIGKPRMEPNSPNRLKGGRTIVLSLGFTIVLLTWSYFNFQVPRSLYRVLDAEHLFDQAGRDLFVGVVMALDNIIAVLLQPIFGSLSDRTKSRMGRRMPFIAFGSITSAILFICFPFMNFVWGLVAIIFLFDLAMSLYRSASIAIVPDYTIEKFRAKASGIQQLIANFGGAIGFAIPMIAGIFPANVKNSIGYFLVAALMIALIIPLILFAKETPTGNKIFAVSKTGFVLDPLNFTLTESVLEEKEKKQSGFRIIGRIFTQKDKSMVFALLFVFFTFLGFAAIETFFSSFAIEYIFEGLPEAEAASKASSLALAYPIPMILTAYFHGLLGQKYGRKKIIKTGMIEIGILLLFLILYSIPQARAGNLLALYVNLVLIGTFWMMVIVNTFPVIWALAPPSQVGVYTGVYYTFNQLAYTLSPIIMGAILGFISRHVNPISLRFRALFPFLLVCFVIAFIFLLFIKGGEGNLDKNKVEEYTGKYVTND
jgi:maltose/moltooligosaccharide transporter